MTMTEARFEALLDAYGANPNRWPLSEQAAALAFLRAQAQVAEPAVAEARRLDALLDAYGLDSPPERLGLAVRAAALASPPAATRGRMVTWGLGAGLAASMAGLLAGVSISERLMTEARVDAVISAAASGLTADEAGVLEKR